MSRLRPGLSCCHAEQRLCSAYHIQPLARRFHDPLQFSRFLFTQRPQGLFLGLCHVRSPSLSAPVYHFHDPTAMYLLVDPLVGHAAIKLSLKKQRLRLASPIATGTPFTCFLICASHNL